MDVEHIFVVFESPNGKDLWKAVAREDIPDWMRDPAVIDKMLAGEQAAKPNLHDGVDRWYKVVEVDRPRPAGQRQARQVAAQAALGLSPGGIALSH